jgi:hypothetical protein
MLTMGVKKNSKSKNSRHHINTVSSIVKKQSAKAKLRNHDLRAQLDKATGLAGAVNLFARPVSLKEKRKLEKETKIETEKAVEEDILALMSMKLSSTKAH